MFACRQYMRKIIEIDQSRPGICTEAGLAQAQFHLSEILRLRAEEANIGGKEPRVQNVVSQSRMSFRKVQGAEFRTPAPIRIPPHSDCSIDAGPPVRLEFIRTVG